MIHNDHLGSPQKMTDSAGVVQWSADYKPFGEATVTVSTITNNLRFPGQYYDAETGLNYNYFRDYNSIIGRYIEADKIGIRRGQNHLYFYVRNNPSNFIDSYGLFTSGPGLPPDYFNPFNPDIWQNTQIFKAGWEEVKKTKECKYWICIVNCSVDIVIGEITEALAEKIIKEAAKKVAQEMVEQLIPYYDWYNKSISTYKGIKCFVDCHEK